MRSTLAEGASPPFPFARPMLHGSRLTAQSSFGVYWHSHRILPPPWSIQCKEAWLQIALIHYSAPPIVGGVESVLAAHANLLAEMGHSVRVIAGRGAAWRDDIPVVVLPLADSRAPEVLACKSALDKGEVPSDFAALVETLTMQLGDALAGCDVVIAHNVCSLNKNLALTAALHELSQQVGAPAFVLWHHDLAWTTPRYAAELRAGYPWSLLRTAWQGATQVVVSRLRQQELADLMALPLDEVHVVPNGVDLARFFKLEEATQQIIDEYDLLTADPLLLLPVRLTPRKNIELALRVLAALRSEMPRARLLVSGPLGPHNPANAAYFEQLKTLRDELALGDSAILLAERSSDFLPDEVIADFYRLADALFFPSREEGFGIPMLEAGLSHLPIFAADIAPLRELGAEHVYWFSPDGNPDVIARQIAGLLQQSPVQRMAVRARAFTWKRIGSEVIEPLLQNAAQRNRH